METVKEMQKRHRDEVNTFQGLFFAFSDVQLTEWLERVGLAKDDFKSIVSIGGGGYLRKDRLEAFHAMFERHASERKEDSMTDNQRSEIILYSSPSGQVKVDVFLQDENVWLTQKRMAELFNVEVNTINYHVKEIFKLRELSEEATIRKFRIVQNEGGREVERETDFYNLDMIISVGYRVNSQQATQFRIWATRVLREYIIKGFALDDERLKSGKSLRESYFDEARRLMKTIKIKFAGIDSWNRPVFKSIEKPYSYFGSVMELFNHDATEEQVLEKIDEDDLVYFGGRFNCEPMGSPSGNIEIVKTESLLC